MAIKKTTDKTTNIKKDELESKVSEKPSDIEKKPIEDSSATKNKTTLKRSSVVKKEVTPISIDSSLISKKREPRKTVEKVENKTTPIKERPSVALLREALKSAKTKSETDGVATKTLSKKYSLSPKEETVAKKEEKIVESKEEKVIEKTDDKIKADSVKKATYSKKDLMKPKNVKATPVILDENTVKEEIKEEVKEDKPINIVASDDLSEITKNQAIEEEKKEKEEIKFNESKNALLDMMNKNKSDVDKTKDSPQSDNEKELLRQIELKSKAIPLENLKTNTPVQPYVYKPMRAEKKSKKPFLVIIGILAVIFGGTFTAFQFINKDDYNKEVIVDNVIVDDDALTNETKKSTEDDLYAFTENNFISNETETAIEENIEVSNENQITTPIDVIEPEKVEVIEEPIVEQPIVEEPKKEVITNILEEAPEAPTPPVAPTFVAPSYENTLSTQANQKVYIVKWQDTMQSIALKELGDANRWPTIYSMNKNILRTPDRFNFGDQLNLPSNSKAITEMTQDEKNSLYNDYMITIEAYKNAGKNNLANALQAVANTLK